MNQPNSHETLAAVSSAMDAKLDLIPTEEDHVQSAQDVIRETLKTNTTALADYQTAFAQAILEIKPNGIGAATAHKLADVFVTGESLRKAKIDDLLACDFMAQATAHNLFMSMQEPEARAIFADLAKHPGADLQTSARVFDLDEHNTKVLFMGNHAADALASAKSALRKAGGKVTSFLNPQTTIVVLDGPVPARFQRKKNILEGIPHRALSKREKELQRMGEPLPRMHPKEGKGIYKVMTMATFNERLGLKAA